MMFSQYHNTQRIFKRLAKALIRLRRTYHIVGNLMSRLIQRRNDALGSWRLAHDVITS